ncbi:MAG: 6-phosphofructokinase [Bacteroidota bacterium]
MKKIAVFTSGGDSPGMNACVRAVVRAGIHYGLEVFGVKRGYKGMIDGDFVKMDAMMVSNIIQRGGTILLSSRSDRFRTKEGRQQAYEKVKAAGIEGIVAIGGNGTFAGARIFSEEFDIPVIGVPGTIDNDLYGTDKTIGYDTALNTIVEAIDKIRDTADSHNRVFFVEVMGRDAGFLALNSGIAGGVESILIPEIEDDFLNLVQLLKKGWKRVKSSLIVLIAEGDEEGGAVKVAEQLRGKFPDLETRVVILGHLQRGGRPSCYDRVLATRLGVSAVEALINGQSDIMVGEINNVVVPTPLEKAVKQHHEFDKGKLHLLDIMSD